MKVKRRKLKWVSGNGWDFSVGLLALNLEKHNVEYYYDYCEDGSEIWIQIVENGEANEADELWKEGMLRKSKRERERDQ